MPSCPVCPPRPQRMRSGCHDNVPVHTQYASADLIEAIAYRGHDPIDDPAWQASGAASLEEYGLWCRHLCGLACFQSVLHHYFGRASSLFELLDGSREKGAYVEENGSIRGLIYAPFAQYVREVHGLQADVYASMPLAALVALVSEDYLVMASVSKEIRNPEIPSPGRGGHLVLVIGHDPATGTLMFRNPSGHTERARVAELPMATFDRYFGSRGMAFHKAS